MVESRRKVRDRADAASLLMELERSGQSLREFSAVQGVDGRSLHCWSLNLGRGSGGGAERGNGLRLVEITAGRAAVAAQRYRVHVEDVVVEVESGFEESELARLLWVVRRC